MTFWTLPDVFRPRSRSMLPSPSRYTCQAPFAPACSSASRFVRDCVHFDLALDDGARLDRGAGKAPIREVFGEHLVVAPEVARVFEVDGHFHDIAEIRALERQDPLDALDGPARLVL